MGSSSTQKQLRGNKITKVHFLSLSVYLHPAIWPLAMPRRCLTGRA